MWNNYPYPYNWVSEYTFPQKKRNFSKRCLSFGEECRSVKFGPTWSRVTIENPERKVAFLLGKSVLICRCPIIYFFSLYNIIISVPDPLWLLSRRKTFCEGGQVTKVACPWAAAFLSSSTCWTKVQDTCIDLEDPLKSLSWPKSNPNCLPILCSAWVMSIWFWIAFGLVLDSNLVLAPFWIRIGECSPLL